MPATSHRSFIAALVATLTLLAALGPAAAPARADDETVTIVDADAFVPDLRPAGTERLTARERENLRVTTPRAMRHPGGVGGAVADPAADRVGVAATPTAAALVDEGASAMTFDWSGVADDAFGLRSTLAMAGTRAMSASRTELRFYSGSRFALVDYTGGLSGFFDLPSHEYWWGAAVAASIRQGRFVVVLPSYQDRSKDCARGYLNVAVSKTSNPNGRWLRYRIPTPDAWTDAARIGLSDDKVVLTFNEFDLAKSHADCQGGGWEGARIKVMDWSDLLDGGALTVQDVSPTPRTNYWNWTPAVNTPTAGSTSAGSTIRLVGDRYTSAWGAVAYASITGSAKKGTTALIGNANLTSKRDLDPLLGTTETIAGMASGNGGLDESIVSVAARGSRLYFTTHTVCRLLEDPDFRTCARIVELNTATTLPTVVQDVWYVGLEQDTFLPQVGIARDGTVFLVMSRSSAVTPGPTDHFVVYREPGEPFDQGPLEVRFEVGENRPQGPTGTEGSVVPDPGNVHRVVTHYGQETPYGSSSRITALVGNLTAEPGGSASFGTGTGWVIGPYLSFTLAPDPASPTMWVRWSGSPDTTDTPGGPMLTNGFTSISQPAGVADFSTAELGGATTDPFTAYVQWQTGDGAWSTPLATELSIDTVPPSTPVLTRSFATGSVSTTIPFRLTWPLVTDDESGVARIQVERYDSFGNDDTLQATLDGAATGVALRLHASSPTTLPVTAIDAAGNASTGQVGPFTVREIEDGSSAIDYSSGWTRVSSSTSKSTDKSVRYATRAGAKATYAFTGSAVAFVSTRGPKMGKVEIWVDGALATTIDLHRSSTAYRQLVWHTRWDTAGSHTVVVKVVGGSGRVDVDQFLRF